MAINFTAGTSEVPIPDFVLKQQKLFTDPVCPAFPDASVFLGGLSCWFFNLCAWMGIPLGRTLKEPLHALMTRHRRVTWARKSPMERTLSLCVVSFAGLMLLPFIKGFRSTGVMPPGNLR